MSKPELLSDLMNKIEKGPYERKSKEYLRKSLCYESISNIYFSMNEYPPVIIRGKDVSVWDLDGKEYIDVASGFSVHNIGHCHPKVVEAVKQQSEKLVQWCAMPNELRLEYSKKLVEISPGKSKKKVHLLTTGGESVEFACKLARYYKAKPLIMAFQGCYHGVTGGIINATTYPSYRASDPFLQNTGFVHVPYAYCYRCPFGREYPECKLFCADYIEYLLEGKLTAASDIATLIVEPIQGVGGYIVPPDEYIPELAKICKDHGILLFMDEIQTAFGRYGDAMTASEALKIEPDIMCVGKALSGGFPLSAAITRDEIAAKWEPIKSSETFMGNLLMCAVAMTNINILEEMNAPMLAKKIGTYMLRTFKETLEDLKIIGDIRGKGGFLAIE